MMILLKLNRILEALIGAKIAHIYIGGLMDNVAVIYGKRSGLYQKLDEIRNNLSYADEICEQLDMDSEDEMLLGSLCNWLSEEDEEE